MSFESGLGNDALKRYTAGLVAYARSLRPVRCALLHTAETQHLGPTAGWGRSAGSFRPSTRRAASQKRCAGYQTELIPRSDSA